MMTQTRKHRAFSTNFAVSTFRNPISNKDRTHVRYSISDEDYRHANDHPISNKD